MKITFSLPLVLALAAVLGATPADAQGRGKGGDRDRQEQRDVRRDRDDDDDDRPRFERRRTDDRRSDDRRYDPSHGTRQQRRVPPGWCQGRGNPHNTPENCRYNSRQGRWERYDSRTGRYETYDTYNRSGGSYEAAHRDFHDSHDRRCRERAAQRPLDVRWQIQVRSECKAVHDDFHRRWGIAHR
ncbi:MAG TPA: hypothetical protein VF142_10375 [Longimicrobium sp.]